VTSVRSRRWRGNASPVDTLGMVAAEAAAMSYRTALGLALGLSTFSLVAAAQPQPTPGMPTVNPNSPAGVFGQKGQLAIMGEGGAMFTHTSVSGRNGSTTTVLIRPAIDYFIIDHLSLGAFTGVEYSSATSSSTTTYGIGPRVGFDIPFSERFSLWPKAGLSFNSTTIKLDPITVGGIRTPASSASNTALDLNLFVPIMFHSNHYFAGFGPSLDTDLSGSPKATTFAARLILGGWLF
jgi:hypothetical protein